MSLSISSVFFLFLIFTTFASSSTFLNNRIHKCPEKQSEALLLFKHNLSSINYTDDDLDYFCHRMFSSDYHPIITNWNTSTDCCNWNGVTCDNSTGDVIGLDLGCGMLQGTIHPNSSLFNLPHLQKLNLAFNNFTGSRIPREIGRFSNSLTHLNLSRCGFSGQVPSEFTLLHKLETLDLFLNTLTGDIPSDISVNLTHLTYLRLSDNRLNGTLPSWLFTSPSLQYLDLNDNMLSGNVPFDSFTSPSLDSLDLSGNMLSGNVPFESFSLPSLKYLYLDHNQFGGQIDVQTFPQLTNLTLLGLGYNNFSGELELDSLLSTLTNLYHLDLSYSGFSVTTNNTNHYVNPRFWFLGLASCKLKVFPNSFRAMKQLVGLDLSSNEIHGQIPHWAGEIGGTYGLEIGGNGLFHLNLSHNFITALPQFQWYGLSELYLQSNLIQGPFPPSICNMSSLSYLDLSNNSFGGVIPECVGSMSTLSRIDLGTNNFHGTIPKNISSSLQILNIKSNKIEGFFPQSICNTSNLYSLDISNNSFGGVIPECVGSMMSTLSMINLGTNYFHGTIPNVFNECRELVGLILNGNQLEGELPHSLSKCQFLKVLDLGNNKLSGAFPEWLGGLSELQVLVLRSNNFHGPIEISTPMEHAFSSLQVLDLSHNWFAGKLPGIFFQNFKAMQNLVRNSTKPKYLSVGGNYYSISVVVKDVQLTFTQLLVDYTIVDLSNNRFEGEIPDTIGSFNSLKALNLSHNNLNGEIPNALGKLLGTESLDLSWNQFIGEIPQSLAEIKGLAVLNLSENHLVGRIPTGTQFNTFDESSYGGNLGLCGFPLSNKCEHLSSPDVYGDGDEEEVNESGITWKLVMLGYGCGTLVGLVMGYLMLSTRKVKWFNAIADAAESLVLKKMKKKRRHISIGK